MALQARLELRQGQSLVITPQLQQAIKLLQLSNIELEAFVEAEMEKNPLLQWDEVAPPTEPEQPEAPPPSEAEMSSDRVSDAQAQSELDAPRDDVYADEAPGDRGGAEADSFGSGPVDWSRSGGSGDLDAEGMEGSLSSQKTLAEHLHDQVAVSGLSDRERVVAASLIGDVDDGGYLRADLEEVAERLGCAVQMVEHVLTVLQGFEPTGVFARDVRECLALQLKERDRLDPAMAALLDNLEVLARRDMPGLRKLCGVDDEDLREMIAELRALTPRPGAAFGGEPSAPVVPDVYVREGLGGLWHVELNTDTLPRLLVDQRYHARIATGARSDQEKMFVSECLNSANWLVRSLDQRAKTILKVASEIVRQQDGFLAFGVEHLRPLNLKTVADAIGMHESTVSRVTSNKYMATPRGVFELKFFFTASIASTSGGEAHSAESVRHRIKALIDSERDPPSVLSDDRIVEILNEAGVDIARRTVAKYREAMRIPSSVERRRLLREAV